MDLDSILYNVVDSQDDYYYFHIFSACHTFEAKKEAKAFDSEQIKRLVSLYLIKLHEAKLLDLSPYPHTDTPRYRRTDLFRQIPAPPKIEMQNEFKPTFFSELEMQRAFCNLELLECYSELEPYEQSDTKKVTIEKSNELAYQSLKDKLDFLQEKICVIDKLLDMTNSDKP